MEVLVANAVHTEATTLSAYEIERGKPMPNLTHGSLQLNIGFELKLNYGSKYRIASEVALDTPFHSTTPDVLLYANRELNFVNEVAKQTVAPLLTVEIESPSQSMDEMIDKVQVYFDFGVKSCWVVVPAMKGVAVYEDKNSFEFYKHDEILHDKNLNIEIDLQKIFI
jgi:Uma2 family endonuclease